MKTFLAALGILLAATVGFLGGTVAVLLRGMPQVSSLQDFAPPSSSKVYASDGSLVAEFATERRTPVPLDALPADLVRCVLAIEDHRYFEHMGINVGRIVKALVVDLVEGRIVEGGSTITQQLVKVLFLKPEKTFSRKVREAFLALEIERRYTKREILSLYLNQIYLGNGAYGVAAAAEVYFGRPLAGLTLSECALLAALPKAPQTYDPFHHPDRARARRAVVLERMAELGWADAATARAAEEDPLPVPRPRRAAAPYFVETVRRQLIERLGSELVYQGGLRVYTTLDSHLQQVAEQAVAQGLAAVEKRHPGRKAAPVQGAALAVDPLTGAVRAQVGGRNWIESSFDRSLQARRQPGSSFKPFIYLAALEAGWTEASVLNDAPSIYPGARPDTPWRPDNYDREFLGKMTLRRALALSRNVPAVRLLDRIGKPRVDELAHRMGLAGPLGEGLATALGVGGATLLELVRAYAALPAGGLMPEPYWIRAVYGPDERNLWPPPASPRKVLDPVTAYVGSDLLKAVVDSGTGYKAHALGFPVGGKTGTTDDLRDAWFVGFSSRLATGVWVGRDDNRPLGAGESGSDAALPIWVEIMRASASDGPPPPWPVPDSVTFDAIDTTTGERTAPGTGTTVAFARPPEPLEPAADEPPPEPTAPPEANP
ncbi:MAG: PBP1A family penicillin-binding protein [Deltaproteobacteria bacterium]|nr:PBP1A family penicillin-binding protein [Deltaproteobacteria bacterium]